MENIIKTVGSVILTVITFLFGKIDIAIQVLLFCIVVDYITEIIIC